MCGEAWIGLPNSAGLADSDLAAWPSAKPGDSLDRRARGRRARERDVDRGLTAANETDERTSRRAS